MVFVWRSTPGQLAQALRGAIVVRVLGFRNVIRPPVNKFPGYYLSRPPKADSYFHSPGRSVGTALTG